MKIKIKTECHVNYLIHDAKIYTMQRDEVKNGLNESEEQREKKNMTSMDSEAITVILKW